jgi:hypothetical protein
MLGWLGFSTHGAGQATRSFYESEVKRGRRFL